MAAEEVLAIVEGVNDRYRALMVLLAGSGVRPGEALGLTVDRVQWLRRTVRIDRQLISQAGIAPHLGPTKTPSSVRTIPVPQAVLDELAHHLEQFGTGAAPTSADGAITEGLIFTDANGAPIRRSALGHMWRRSVVAINKGGAVQLVERTPHDLRHYAASVMIAQGASVKAVQKHLGHAKASTTLDTYAHLFPDSEDITRRALEAGLAAIVSPLCHEDAGSGPS